MVREGNKGPLPVMGAKVPIDRVKEKTSKQKEKELHMERTESAPKGPAKTWG